jgi:hypothetical protein
MGKIHVQGYISCSSMPDWGVTLQKRQERCVELARLWFDDRWAIELLLIYKGWIFFILNLTQILINLLFMITS